MTDIILILYGDSGDLNRCVASIHQHCSDYNIIIRDNNKENKGFTKACNEGIANGKGEYIWLLNQDAQVLAGAQQALIRRLDSHPKVGIVGSMQLDPKNPERIAHGGTTACFPAGRHKGGLVSMGHCRIPEKCTWVNGASMMFKRAMYNDIGALDNDLFLLYSDSDYCYVARQAGYEVWYEPESKIYHTLGKASKGSAEWQQKDMLAFMKKWGITVTKEGQFVYSREFSKLDMFP